MSNKERRPLAAVPILARMTGVVRLHAPTYEEIRLDRTANRQAVAVVVAAALAIGFGIGPGLGIPFGFVLYWVTLWSVWVLVVSLTAPAVKRTLDAEGILGQLGRTTGFAQAPALFFMVLSFVGGLDPTFTLAIFGVISLWWFAAMTSATRQALRLDSLPLAALVAATFLVPIILIDLGIS